MNNLQIEILTQTSYYGILMLLTIMIIAFMLRGFFWTYIKVKLSFGKYIMIKLRTSVRDYFKVGWVEEGFLCYKVDRKDVRRFVIPKGINVFYRCMGVNWVDMEEEVGAFAKTDYSATPGFDSQKFSDLYIRALMRPNLSNNMDKILFILVMVAMIGALAGAYLGYMGYNNSEIIKKTIESIGPTIANSCKATIVGGPSI